MTAEQHHSNEETQLKSRASGSPWFPGTVRLILSSGCRAFWGTKSEVCTFFVRTRMQLRRANTVARVGNQRVRVTGGADFYIQYKDIFKNEIYRFEAIRPDPLIIDGGSNMGMSVLYYKRLYPRSKIIAFEPDPAIFQTLKENIALNGLQQVTLVNAGLGTSLGRQAFVPDGAAGGHAGMGEGAIEVDAVCLSDYLNDEVDFLKLNIEGAELEVLRETAKMGRLQQVREIVIEYHGWAGERQCLHQVLELLNDHGFRYMIHDFDAETCSSTKPPFRLTRQTTWFCLVYGRRDSVL